LLKKTANIQIYVELNITGLRPRPRKNTHDRNKKKCFLPHFHPWAGGWDSPTTQKNTSFALGMRRVRSRDAACGVSEAIA